MLVVNEPDTVQEFGVNGAGDVAMPGPVRMQEVVTFWMLGRLKVTEVGVEARIRFGVAVTVPVGEPAHTAPMVTGLQENGPALCAPLVTVTVGE